MKLDMRMSFHGEEAERGWRRIPKLEEITARAARAAFRAAESERNGPRAGGRAELSLVFSGNEHVRELNRLWRGRDRPTNVLSFPIDDSPPEPGETRLLGDVVLAFETVLEEAGKLELAPEHHLAHLVVHGVLHLCGFDHETDREAEEMETLEARILTRMGIADPYARR